MAKYLVQAAIAATQAVGKAFIKAVRQEIAVSQAAAAKAGGGKQGAKVAATNAKLGLSLEEAKQILNVKELNVEDVQKNYDYLFRINDRTHGGSLYLQSKMALMTTLHSCYSNIIAKNNYSNHICSSDSVISVGLHPLTRQTVYGYEFSHNSPKVGRKYDYRLNSFSTVASVRQYHTRRNSAVGINNGSVRYSTATKVTWDDVLSEENRSRWLENTKKGSSPMVSKTPAEYLKKEAITSEKNKNGTKKDKEKKCSAVLMPLCHVSGELCLLYTVRSRELRHHTGEVSFPGGMQDTEDQGDPVKTAIREANEEIGLDTSVIDVWGPSQSIPSRLGGSVVTGVLAYVGHIRLEDLNLNSEEVSDVFAVSLKNLCKPENFAQTQFRSSAMKRGGYAIPVFTASDPKIWGVTAVFTHMTLKALLPGLYSHNLKFIPTI